MPAPPELGDAAGNVGVVEVLREIKAEQLSQTDGHIAVAGEVEVDVQHVGDGIEPEKQDGLVLRGTEDLAELAHSVGDEHLFAQTQDKAADAQCRLVQTVPPGGELLRDLGIAHDGAGDQLGKEGDIGRKVDKAPLGRDAPVHVHGVADELEGVKADADGQGDPEQGQGKAGDGVEILNEEVRVLEKAQYGGTEAHRQNEKQPGQPPAPVTLNEQGEKIAAEDGQEHEQHILRLAPGVEKQAGKQQNAVFQLFRGQKIDNQHTGQKIIQKAEAGKQQDRLSFPTHRNTGAAFAAPVSGLDCAHAGHMTKNTVFPTCSAMVSSASVQMFHRGSALSFKVWTKASASAPSSSTKT